MKGFAKLAVELVSYGKHVENAIKFVFSTFV